MSKIEFPFAAMAKLFGHIIDLTIEKNHKKLVFAFWSLSKTFTVPHIHHGENYDAYEFSCSFEEIAESLGVSVKVAKGIVKFFTEIGWLIKTCNKITNRPNRFKWDTQKFVCEKVVPITDNLENHEEKRADQNLEKNLVHKLQKGPTNLRVKMKKKGPTKKSTDIDLKKEEKGRPHEKRADQRADQFTSENEEKRADQMSASIETIESLCLKETNINKEKVASPIEGKDLFLSHEEKDLLVSSDENQLAEHQKALEAYINYRDISQITSNTITRWLINYPIEDIKGAIGLMLSSNKHVANPGGWIESALQKGIVRKERVKNQNIAFAKEMQPKNKYLRVNSRYCQDIRFRDKEFYYHIDPQIFQEELRKCL